RIKEALEEGDPVRSLEFTEEDQKYVNQAQLLTSKEMLYIANVGEDEIGDEDNEKVQAIREYANNKHYKLISQKAYEKEIDVEVPKGATLSILVEDDKAIGTVALGDELKSTSKHLIDTLKNHGIEPIMAT